MRINQATRLNITPSLDAKIQLYNMTEEVFWADLDRYRVRVLYVKKSRSLMNLTLLSSDWDCDWRL